MRRVVLTGSESTGKTELAPRLAAHFGALWVPEFVRRYAEQKGAPLTAADVEPIARGQIALEDMYRARNPALLIQDTDLVSTLVYARHYYDFAPTWLQRTVRQRRPDLYLLLDIDVPWVPDGVRDRGDRREEMQALFATQLEAIGARYVVVRGTAEERFAAAVAAIEELPARARPET